MRRNAATECAHRAHAKNPTTREDCDEAREFARASNPESVQPSALRAMRQPPGCARMVRTSQRALHQASVVVRNLRLSVRTISLFCKRFNKGGGRRGRRQGAPLVSDKFPSDSNFYGVRSSLARSTLTWRKKSRVATQQWDAAQCRALPVACVGSNTSETQKSVRDWEQGSAFLRSSGKRLGSGVFGCWQRVRGAITCSCGEARLTQWCADRLDRFAVRGSREISVME